MRHFADVRHATQYLSGGLIRVADEPAYVMGISDRWDLEYTLDGRNVKTTKLKTDESIDITPVPLGLCNISDWGTDCIQISRTPLRQSRIGLDFRNMKATGLTGEILPGYNNQEFFLSRHLRNTIKGNYPTFKEALKQIQDGSRSVAFCRTFYVDKQLNLGYKDYGKVGKIVKESPVLDEKYFYLKEVLNENH